MTYGEFFHLCTRKSFAFAMYLLKKRKEMKCHSVLTFDAWKNVHLLSVSPADLTVCSEALAMLS